MRLSMRSPGIAALAFSISGALCPSQAAAPGTVEGTPSSGKTAARPASHKFAFIYETSYSILPRESQRLDVWIPLPWRDENQEITNLVVYSPGSGTMITDPEYGNMFFHFMSGPRGGVPVNIRVSFEAERFEIPRENLADKPAATPTPPPGISRYLKEDRLSPLDDEIKAIATRITEGESSQEGKARAIYDHVVEKMKLEREGDDWGQGDLKHIISTNGGNSLDLSAAFVGLCRAAGVPARVVIGFKIPETSGMGYLKGYHAWSEFYLEGFGWIPVDCADAVSDPSLREARFGGLDPYRLQISVGRDVTLQPLQSGEPMNYLLYPYAESEGKPLGHAIYRFTYDDPAPEATEPADAPQ